MGLFENVGGMLKGVLDQAQGADAPDALSEALPHLGGLQSVITALQQGGLANQVQSWLGNGTNLPVTAEQIRDALGTEQVKQLAGRLGLPIDGVLNLLAQHLPTAVDQASPNGTLQPAA